MCLPSFTASLRTLASLGVIVDVLVDAPLNAFCDACQIFELWKLEFQLCSSLIQFSFRTTTVCL